MSHKSSSKKRGAEWGEGGGEPMAIVTTGGLLSLLHVLQMPVACHPPSTPLGADTRWALAIDTEAGLPPPPPPWAQQSGLPSPPLALAPAHTGLALLHSICQPAGSHTNGFAPTLPGHATNGAVGWSGGGAALERELGRISMGSLGRL